MTVNELNNVFGANLRRLRLKRGLTQVELARLIDMPRNDLADIENGHHFIRSTNFIKIINAFNVTPDELFKCPLYVNKSWTEVGCKIRQRRVELKLTLKDLASELGFSAGFLSRVENGKCGFPKNRLARLAIILGVDIAELS